MQPAGHDPVRPVFYYDLGSPRCYIVAETIMSGLPVVSEWEPVWSHPIGGLESQPDRTALEREARKLGLQPLRWPTRWPPDTRRAMLAATYAKRVGRAVAFSLAAFRQTFAAGRNLDDEETLVIAGAACEMHPTAVLKGISLRSVAGALDEATARALAAGVKSLPAVQLCDRVFEGDVAVQQAALALGGLE